MKLSNILLSFGLASLVFACSSAETKSMATASDASPPKASSDGGTAKPTATKPKTKVSTSKISDLKGSKPPAGAKPQGTKSAPKAGGTTIPIQGVEVYLVTLDFDGDGQDEPLYWASTETTTYVWLEGPVACDDGLNDGTGGFIAEVREDGSGAYLFAVDQCPEQNLFGCEFDSTGTETACGACAWNDDVIACVAAAD